MVTLLAIFRSRRLLVVNLFSQELLEFLLHLLVVTRDILCQVTAERCIGHWGALEVEVVDFVLVDHTDPGEETLDEVVPHTLNLLVVTFRPLFKFLEQLDIGTDNLLLGEGGDVLLAGDADTTLDVLLDFLQERLHDIINEAEGVLPVVVGSEDTLLGPTGTPAPRVTKHGLIEDAHSDTVWKDFLEFSVLLADGIVCRQDIAILVDRCASCHRSSRHGGKHSP